MSYLTVVRVEDCEYEGTCSICGKEGVRWVVIMSDGSRVGGECAKKLLGWKPSARNYSWVTNLSPVSTRVVPCLGNVVLWESKSKAYGVISVNGNKQASGSFEWIAKEYAKRYPGE